VNGTLRVCDGAQALAELLADAFVSAARDAVAARERFAVALAGGSTPRGAYELLAIEPRRSQVSWDAVRFYFGDERCVPPEDPESNYGMARDALLAPLGVPQTHVHRMRGEIPPAQAAVEYALILRETLGEAPQLDLCMLGIGADGHTASLFPGHDPLTDDDDLVRAVYGEAVEMWRLTITPKVINSSREVLFGVSGAQKAAALRAIREGPYDPVRYPAQIVRPHGGRVVWIADAAAAP
jgi:6-phosphogluconolactonase